MASGGVAEAIKSLPNGQLRSIKGNIPFRFDVKEGDQNYNQAHYEALGKVIEQHIYHLLSHQEDLERVVIPLDAIEGEPTSCIFRSRNIDQYEKLLILVHGSGVVRAGQWTRKLIINHSLESGSQIPYIRKAQLENYGVVVLNTNQNEDIETGEGIVRGNGTPENHFLYVWDKIIEPSGVRHIAIMAHSYGGLVVLEAVNKRPGEFKERVFAIAMSDSIHGVGRLGNTSKDHLVKEFFKESARNWVSSKLPLDSHVESNNPIDSNRVSAGTLKHIKTSWYAFASVFDFFQRNFDHKISQLSRRGIRSTPSSPIAAENETPVTDVPRKDSKERRKLSEEVSSGPEANEPETTEAVSLSTEVITDEGKDILTTVTGRRLSNKQPVEHELLDDETEEGRKKTDKDEF
eukprot:gene6276-11696_t